ncbi:holin [Mycobacterium kansasii]
MASSELFTLDFWQRTLTQALHSAAAAAVTPLANRELDLIGSVPWYSVGSAAAIGALVSLLLSVASARVPGTLPASFLPSKLGGDKDT